MPSLAIHLYREDTPKICSEENLQPIFTVERKGGDAANGKNNESKHVKTSNASDDQPLDAAHKQSDHHDELLELVASEAGCAPNELLEFDLRAYDTQKATIGGANGEFLFSARLDNLVSVYASIKALIESADANVLEDEVARVAFCFDHEEIGSCSAAGARSDVVAQILKRIYLRGLFVFCVDRAVCNRQHFSGDDLSDQNYSRGIHRSFIISADQAHAAHPNYGDKHEVCFC